MLSGFPLLGQDMYAISRNGQELAYTSNIDEVEATSTNNEIFNSPMGGGASKKISTSPGKDNTPRYSPDGKYFAGNRWRAVALRRTRNRCFYMTPRRGKKEISRRLSEQLHMDCARSATWKADSASAFYRRRILANPHYG